MNDNEHILETVKHIRGDLEEACRIDGLLRGLDDSPIAENWDSIGRDIRDPLALINVSLLTRLVLDLARMHDAGKTNGKFNDRMCLAGIFERLEKEENADLKGALLPTRGQEESYGMALKNWKGRENTSCIRGMIAAVKAANSGDSKKITEISKSYKLDNLLKNLRDYFLAHNLNHLNEHGMRYDELRYILEMTIEIVEPLEKALTETSVPYSNTREIWHRKAEAFWGLLSR